MNSAEAANPTEPWSIGGGDDRAGVRVLLVEGVGELGVDVRALNLEVALVGPLLEADEVLDAAVRAVAQVEVQNVVVPELYLRGKLKGAAKNSVSGRKATGSDEWHCEARESMARGYQGARVKDLWHILAAGGTRHRCRVAEEHDRSSRDAIWFCMRSRRPGIKRRRRGYKIDH